MQYIGGEQRAGCLFCRVIEDPNDPDADLVVWRPDGAIVMLNKFPYNAGHAMVAPLEHKGSLEELGTVSLTKVMQAVQRSISVLRQVMNPEGFNVGVNIGRAAGAGIPDHVHFHIVPRWNGDTNFMPVLDDVKVINEALAQTVAKLRQAFAAS